MAGRKKKDIREMLFWKRLHYTLVKLDYRFRYLNNPEKYIKAEYKKVAHDNLELNLKSPQRLTEKLNWLKLYYKNDKMYHLGDKYQARKCVAKRIGKKYLVPIYDYCTKSNELDFNKYPNSFVIKGTHSSGDVILCKNKNRLNTNKVKKTIDVWMKNDFYKFSKEPSYLKAVPGVIVEKYLNPGKYNTPKDYKVFCFNGKPKYIGVYTDRYGSNNRVGEIVYDTEWNIMPFIFGTVDKFDNSLERKEEKPEQLEEMLSVSEKLAEGFPFVRVDLYVVENHIYFGELTFFHLGGYFQCTPYEFDLKLGKELDISALKQ